MRNPLKTAGKGQRSKDMTYDLSKELDKSRFQARCDSLVRKGAVAELTERTFRSSSQNRYLHLIIGVVAMETGNTLAYTKEEYFKRLVNPAIFVTEKEDRFIGKVTVLRSSATLTKEEMSLAIDRFRQWAAENGIFIPEPGDEQRLREMEIEMSRMQRWL